MRDLFVTAIVLGVLPFVFRHAWVGVLLWTWISLMNPHRLAWGFAYSAPFAALAGGATLISLFTSRDPVRLPRDPILYLLLAFIAWTVLTTVFAVFPGESLNQLEKVLKIQLMTVVAMAVLHERKHIQLFVWINALSIAFYGVKGGLFTLQTGGGGRVWGPQGGFIEGNNELGLAMLMTIPLLYYLYLGISQVWLRRGMILMILLTVVAVLGTQSRGALLGIAAMGFVLWLRSPVNKITSGFAILLVGALMFAFMPDSWHDRMGTIRTYEQDSSAMGRINAWETAINIANDKPTGAGFAAYDKLIFDLYAPNPALDRAADPRIARASHSIYFQVLGEHGWIGFALFLSVWWLVWRRAGRLRAQTRSSVEFEWVFSLAGMCQVALVGYLVGGAFLSLAYFDLPFNLLVIVVVTQRWLSAQLVARGAASAVEQSRRGPSRTGKVPFEAGRS